MDTKMDPYTKLDISKLILCSNEVYLNGILVKSRKNPIGDKISKLLPKDWRKSIIQFEFDEKNLELDLYSRL